MEWVETTAKSLEEAKGLALDQLGVAEDEAEFEVLEEPKAGLFGRVRGEARVRARVRPAQVRTKPDRRDRRAKKEAGDAPAADATPRRESAPRPERAPRGDRGDRADRGERGDRPVRPAVAVDPAQVGEEAKRFIAGLVEAFGLEGTTELSSHEAELEINVTGDNLGLLVGPRGTTLQAVQDLARVASQRRLGDHDTRLRVDVGGYRMRRQQALSAFAHKMADEVRATGTARVLEPMGSADRKAIHDALSEVDGITTRSEGDDPFRRVVIAPSA